MHTRIDAKRRDPLSSVSLVHTCRRLTGSTVSICILDCGLNVDLPSASQSASGGSDTPSECRSHGHALDVSKIRVFG